MNISFMTLRRCAAISSQLPGGCSSIWEHPWITARATLLDSCWGDYEKIGFHFDHIYAFEVKCTKPEDVYGLLLNEKYFPVYHWINAGELLILSW